MELAAIILAFIKAIPALQTIFVAAIDLYHEQQDIAADSQAAKVMKEREATIAAMKQVGLSDENRAVLRRRLWELGKL